MGLQFYIGRPGKITLKRHHMSEDVKVNEPTEAVFNTFIDCSEGTGFCGPVPDSRMSIIQLGM